MENNYILRQDQQGIEGLLSNLNENQIRARNQKIANIMSHENLATDKLEQTAKTMKEVSGIIDGSTLGLFLTKSMGEKFYKNVKKAFGKGKRYMRGKRDTGERTGNDEVEKPNNITSTERQNTEQANPENVRGIDGEPEGPTNLRVTEGIPEGSRDVSNLEFETRAPNVWGRIFNRFRRPQQAEDVATGAPEEAPLNLRFNFEDEIPMGGGRDIAEGFRELAESRNLPPRSLNQIRNEPEDVEPDYTNEDLYPNYRNQFSFEDYLEAPPEYPLSFNSRNEGLLDRLKAQESDRPLVEQPETKEEEPPPPYPEQEQTKEGTMVDMEQEQTKEGTMVKMGEAEDNLIQKATKVQMPEDQENVPEAKLASGETATEEPATEEPAGEAGPATEAEGTGLPTDLLEGAEGAEEVLGVADVATSAIPFVSEALLVATGVVAGGISIYDDIKANQEQNNPKIQAQNQIDRLGQSQTINTAGRYVGATSSSNLYSNMSSGSF